MSKAVIWKHYAHGKLLLTGEYAVLDGALALAVPVRYGQALRATAGTEPGQLSWISLDQHGNCWFEARFSLDDLEAIQTTDIVIAGTLQQILRACRQKNPDFLNTGCTVTTQTDFPREWGLGTSSTLIALLARWAEIDPYAVLFETMGGSGYDIACAFAGGPLLYALQNRHPHVEHIDFHPPFADHLFFVFLGKKQNSREGIRRYRELVQEKTGLVGLVSGITRQCLHCRDLPTFNRLLLEHERLIGQALGIPRAQELYFPDFPGVVKSLGAWGGDFVLAAGEGPPEETRAYFAEKGFSTCIPYRDMVLA